jgi:signal peptidase I
MLDAYSIGIIKSRVDSTGFINLPASGNSMFPFIQKGDLCRFISVNSDQLTRGDIVLYHSLTGQLVAHRLLSMKKLKGKRLFILKGDTNLGMDQPVEEQQIIGVLDSIKRVNKIVHMRGMFVRLWGTWILSFPILSGLLRSYVNSKNI